MRLVFFIALIAVCYTLQSQASASESIQKAENFVLQRGRASEHEVYKLALETKRTGSDTAKLAALADDSVVDLMEAGDLAAVAAVAWALDSAKSPLARQYQALLEAQLSTDGKLRGCKSNCAEATALAYLALSTVNPAKSKKIESRLDSLIKGHSN